ncbi:unnamed protein product [Mytilus coruscus]|uniref:Uncharacterized protein n=1 Tax=Mytilus coruscus TaxID=42192 RepID=A0A6J8CQ61_MYTCO|nr:unnamed protein product [Mytilus coruscus]
MLKYVKSNSPHEGVLNFNHMIKTSSMADVAMQKLFHARKMRRLRPGKGKFSNDHLWKRFRFERNTIDLLGIELKHKLERDWTRQGEGLDGHIQWSSDNRKKWPVLAVFRLYVIAYRAVFMETDNTPLCLIYVYVPSENKDIDNEYKDTLAQMTEIIYKKKKIQEQSSYTAMRRLEWVFTSIKHIS